MGSIETIDKGIQIADIVAIVAIVLTLTAAILSFYLRTQQNTLLKREREEDKVRIEEAKRDASIAAQNSNVAIRDAATANMRAAELNHRATEAELRSKELEKELLKLRLDVADRFLPDYVAEALKTQLGKVGHKTVLINCGIANDGEPLEFSNKLNILFSSIGWQSQVRQLNNTMFPPPTGMVIICSGIENGAIARFIRGQMASIGYQCDIREVKSHPVDLEFVIYARH